MSYFDSTSRFPVSADSAAANSSLCARMASATLTRIFPRSDAGVADQSPASNAIRAARMAFSVSTSDASDTTPTTLRSAGLVMVRVAPLSAGTHWPSINSDAGASGEPLPLKTWLSRADSVGANTGVIITLLKIYGIGSMKFRTSRGLARRHQTYRNFPVGRAACAGTQGVVRTGRGYCQ